MAREPAPFVGLAGETYRLMFCPDLDLLNEVCPKIDPPKNHSPCIKVLINLFQKVAGFGAEPLL